MQPPSLARSFSDPAVGLSTQNLVLDRYVRELEGEPLLSPEREIELATLIRHLRCAYWSALLDYPPFLEAILDRVQADVPARKVRSLPLAQTRKALYRYRHRQGRDLRTSLRRCTEAMASALAEADLSCNVADTVSADVEAVSHGRGDSAHFVVRRPRRDSTVFAEYLGAVSRGRWALHRARKEFARANLRLVLSMAQRWRNNGRMSFEDLVQEGNLGLMMAIDRFDPTRGFRFSTYAAWWIRHAINRALSDKGRAVRLPVHVIELQTKLSRLRREFEQRHHREPHAAELAELAGVPVDKVERFGRILLERHVSSTEQADTGRVCEMESIADDDQPEAGHAMDEHHLDAALERALDTLRPMEADILRMRYGLDDSPPMTLREVGDLYSLSRERIRQIQERALGKLRAELASEGFDEPPQRFTPLAAAV